MMRSVVAVIAGYLVFGISAVLIFQLGGIQPHEPASLTFMIISSALGVLAAIASGYVAARLAPQNPTGHGFLVGLLIAAGAIASMFDPSAGTRWSQIAALVLMAPGAVIGARLVRK